MFFQNVAVEMKMEISTNNLVLKIASSNTVVEVLDLKKIYKCAV